MSSVMDIITQKNNADMAEKKKAQQKDPNAQENVNPAPPARVVSNAMRPIRTNENEVIFKSTRPHFAFFYKPGERVHFAAGFLKTDDKEIIKYIKDNFLGTFVTVVEEGPMGTEVK